MTTDNPLFRAGAGLPPLKAVHPSDWPECEEFYDLMQRYRHVNQHSYYEGKAKPVEAYEAVKAWIRATASAEFNAGINKPAATQEHGDMNLQKEGSMPAPAAALTDMPPITLTEPEWSKPAEAPTDDWLANKKAAATQDSSGDKPPRSTKIRPEADAPEREYANLNPALAAAPIWTHDGYTVYKRGILFCNCQDDEIAWYIADRLNAFDNNLVGRNQFQTMWLETRLRNAILVATLEGVKKLAQTEAANGSKVWDRALTLICQALDPQEKDE